MRERLDEVLAAEIGRIAPRLARRLLHDALDKVGRLRAASSTDSVNGNSIGVDPVDLTVDGGDVILPRQQNPIEIGRNRGPEGRRIGAEIGDRMDPHRENLSARVERQFGVRDVVATVRVGKEGLRPLRRPFDWPVDFLGRPNADRFFIVDKDLGPESAADVGRDDPQLVFRRDALKRGQDDPRDMRILAGRMQRLDVGSRIIFAKSRARLHRVGNGAVIDEIERRHVRRFGKGRVCRGLVSDVPVEDGVAWRIVVNLRLTGLGGARRVDDRRQYAVVDDHLLRPVLGLSISIRDDHGDGIADVKGLAMRQGGERSDFHRRSVLGVDGPARNVSPDLVGDRIGAGEHRDDARRLQRR